MFATDNYVCVHTVLTKNDTDAQMHANQLNTFLCWSLWVWSGLGRIKSIEILTVLLS